MQANSLPVHTVLELNVIRRVFGEEDLYGDGAPKHVDEVLYE